MMIDRSPPPPRQEFYAARARRARGWAYLAGFGLIGCILAAIWQEPELSPAVHEKLAQAVAAGETVIARNERIQTFLTRWSSAAQSATGERTDPVTALLEKIKD